MVFLWWCPYFEILRKLHNNSIVMFNAMLLLCGTHLYHAAALLIHRVSEWSRKAALLLLSVRLWSFRDSLGKCRLMGLAFCTEYRGGGGASIVLKCNFIWISFMDPENDHQSWENKQCILPCTLLLMLVLLLWKRCVRTKRQTCVLFPDRSSLLDSQRVVWPSGSGGGNKVSEHIFFVPHASDTTTRANSSINNNLETLHTRPKTA